MKIDPVFGNNDWITIAKAFKSGKNPSTWAVGDTKSVTLKDNVTYTIRLCDMQSGRYTYADGTGSSKAVLEFVELVKVGSTTHFQMNASDTNTGGWASSYMRSTNIPKFEALFPNDILGAISGVNVLSGTGSGTSSGTSSSTNKLFLPAEIEIFSSKTYSIGNAECPLGQFDYYKAHNTNADRTKKFIGATSFVTYWCRSPLSGNNYEFVLVTDSGSIYSSMPTFSIGVPIFFAI